MTYTPFSGFKSCLDAWRKANQDGAALLAEINRDDLDTTRELLRQVIENLRTILDRMYQERDKAEKDPGTADEKRIILRKCVDMYDQEFMVKSSIGTILSEASFFTSQQVTGSFALWKTEAYIDTEVVNQIST
ncbi:hypothetical protein BCR43DRAFT_496160 [Syncephalastrum racemosum]|uniref:Uncharacterized protein n=1 Tax=Syncephalastrum racemosum TaxID=13706 RepID=A0A1X2H3L8_SYNRA|nr:hypothetical protein BCR43DRAFT_496160 [Syncephalastrum racemosum]